MRRYARAVALSLLVVALFYAALWDSGFIRIHWTIALLLIAVAGILRFAVPSRLGPSLPPVIAWSIVLLPGYIALQLVPLPLVLLRFLSPARALSLDALGQVMPPVRFAAISVDSAGTWEHLLRIIGYLVVILLVRELSLRSAARGWQAAWPLIGLAGCEAVLGIVQMATPSLEAAADIARRGTYPNRDHFSALLEMAFPFAAMAVIAAFRNGDNTGPLTLGRVLKAIVPAGAALLILFGILGSLSRMGPVACAAAIFVVIVTGLARRLPLLVKAGLAAGAGALLLGAFLYLAPTELVERYSTTDSSEPRWGIWRDSVHLAEHYPVAGSGLGTFNDTFLTYQTADVSHGYLFAHNDYLQTLGELGIPGFLLIAVLIGGIAFRTIRVVGRTRDPQTRYLALACLGGIAALLVHSFVDFIAYVPADALVFAWILGIAAGVDASSAERKQAAIATPRLGPVFFRRCSLAASAFLLVYGAAWLIVNPRLSSNPALERALCHLGICDNDGMVQRALQSLNTNPTSSAGVAGFQQALRRTPDAPLIWWYLGEAERRAGKMEPAKFSYTRAHALGPNSPFISWQLVTTEILLGDMRQSFAYATEVLSRTRLYDPPVFGFFAAMKTPVQDFLRQVLPPNAEAARAYLRFLIQRSDLSDAITVWDQILPRGYVDDALAKEQVAFLLKIDRPEAAASAWAGYLGKRAGDYPKTNALFNGDFESRPSGVLLDWNILRVPGAKVTLDSTVHFSGAQSLRICFDGLDFNFFDHVWQVFAVHPGVYRVQARVRTQNLVDPGVRLMITSWPEPSALNSLTDSDPETDDWKRIGAQFTVPKNVASARIDILHPAAAVADQKIGGCAWVDAVRVERIQ